MPSTKIVATEYKTWLKELKQRFQASQNYIRRWFLFYTNSETSCATNETIKMAQVVPQLFLIPWGYNRVIVSKFKNIKKSLGVSEYELTHILPNEYKSSLPSIEEIEAELDEK